MKKLAIVLGAFLLALPIMAQEKKSFTLEEIMGGGGRGFMPQSGVTAWWGDKLVEIGQNNVLEINLKNGSKKEILSLEPIKNELKEKGFGELNGMSVQFMKGQNKMLISTRSHRVIYNLDKKNVENAVARVKGAQNETVEQNHLTSAYTKGNNFFVMFNGKEQQVTNDPEGWLNGQSVHRDEFGIRNGIFWSPKGNLVAFYRMDQSMVTDYPQVNTSTRIATLEPDKYPMAGMTSHKVYVGIHNPSTQKTIYVKTADPTDRYFTNISWSPDEKSLFIIELNRDQNHAELIQYNAETGEKVTTLYEETHPKYVEPQNPLTFLPWNDNQFIYQTQRDGFNHLYLMDLSQPQQGKWKECAAGGKCLENLKVTPITKGDWLVKSIVGFIPATKEIVGTGTQESPLNTNPFVVSVVNGKQQTIGNLDGNHRVTLSGSGKYIIDSYSSAKLLSTVDVLATNGKGKTLNLSTATEDPMAQYNLPEIELGTIKAADGVTDLYYRLIKPVNFDPSKKYPAVIYVYGGPHTQLITNSRNYGANGWFLYMAQLGYVVYTVDCRGSSNRGLLFENCTFRHLGTEEMKDQIKGVEFLKATGYVDPTRIGVHGWSYGGFMTTNLMLTYNDVFKTGVAGGPVINWALYEVMYGERYMDTPETNPEGFKGNNLTLRAKDLKGKLQIIIGGNDPTCVPQHTYSFLRACIDAGTQPDLFVYPGDGHNMGGRDRIHLYKRITQYFEDYLK